MLLARRSFLSGILALGCGPAIVRAASIMPVKVMPLYLVDTTPGAFTMVLPPVVDVVEPGGYFAALTAVTRQAFVPRLMVSMYAQSPLLSRLLDKGK